MPVQDVASHKGHVQSCQPIKTHLQPIHKARSKVLSPLPPLLVERKQSAEKRAVVRGCRINNKEEVRSF